MTIDPEDIKKMIQQRLLSELHKSLLKSVSDLSPEEKKLMADQFRQSANEIYPQQSDKVNRLAKIINLSRSKPFSEVESIQAISAITQNTPHLCAAIFNYVSIKQTHAAMRSGVKYVVPPLLTFTSNN